jgi:hypothetical protein
MAQTLGGALDCPDGRLRSTVIVTPFQRTV